MAKRKFKLKCTASPGGTKCKEEFLVEIEDSNNVEQEASNALVRKLEQHFKDNHHKKDQDPWLIKVKTGEKWAVLQADGSIKNVAVRGEPQFEDAAGEIVLQSCSKCGRQLREFEDNSWEKHICSLTLRKQTLDEGNNEIYLDDHAFEELKNNPNQSSNSNPNNFNWKPWAIGGTIVLLIIGIVAYFFTKKKIKDN